MRDGSTLADCSRQLFFMSALLLAAARTHSLSCTPNAPSQRWCSGLRVYTQRVCVYIEHLFVLHIRLQCVFMGMFTYTYIYRYV